jgi:Transmembrane domain of unknown function (DUF3566)
VSTTEHDLDALDVDALDDELGSEIDDDLDLELGPDDVVVVDDHDTADIVDTADIADIVDTSTIDGAHEDTAVDVDALDDDALDDDDVSPVTDGLESATDETNDRLGRFDRFLSEAQADHADDLAEYDGAENDGPEDEADSYVLPEIILATELDEASDADLDDEALDPDARALRPDELEVGDIPQTDLPLVDPLSDDALEELRRANIDGPTVPVMPHDEAPAHRRLKRSPEYDPAPMPIPLNVPRILGRKPRVRRVTRVVRHVDPWSVFKIAIVANTLIYVIVLVAGVLLWNVANATGTVDNVERFFESFGWATFEFNGGEIYHSAWTAGIFLVIGFTGLAVLAATMFNLITDLVGGVRFTVLEEEVVEARTSPMRRFVVRRSEPEIPLVTNDSSGQIIRESVVDDSNGFAR